MPITASFDPVWEDVFRRQVWGKYPSEHVIRLVARNFYAAPDRTQVRLLDLGCGPGASSWFMAREGFDVSAIDGSTTAIAQLHERLAAEGLKADARVGDIVTLPWADATFDGVIDNAAIYANPLDSCRQILSEVHRVLKPGGVLGSAMFSDRCWGYGLGDRVQGTSFRNIPEGPLAGKGLSTFVGRGQVDDLFAAFAQVGVEELMYTLDGHRIEMWIITAKR